MSAARKFARFVPLVLLMCFGCPDPARALSWVTRTWQPVLGPPVRDSSGIVRWTPYPMPVREDVIAWRAGMPPDSASLAEKARAWRALSSDPILGVAALRRLALCQIELGDTAGADSSWARIAATNGLWSWEAVRARVGLAMASGHWSSAESLLEHGEIRDWPEGEQGAWWTKRLEARLASGDTSGTLSLARDALRASTSHMGTGIATVFDHLLAARGASAGAEEEEAMARLFEGAGDRATAAVHEERAFAQSPTTSRIALRLADLMRQSGAVDAARARLEALAPAGGGQADSLLRGEVELGLGRVERDAGRSALSLAHLRRAAALSSSTSLREQSWWEAGQLLERLQRWNEAAECYRRAETSGGESSARDAFRAGLMSLAGGAGAAARADFSRSSGDGALFWRGVLQGPAPGRDALVLLHSSLRPAPLSMFYAMSAAESLAPAMWGAAGVSAAPDPVPLLAPLHLADLLIETGLTSDATTVVERWSHGDPRLGSPKVEDSGRDTLLAAARLAYAAGATRLGIDLALLAALRSSSDGWATLPWMYPPAFDWLYADAPEVPTDTTADRSLLRAIAWQESKFDPAARSRSNALGLLQLKVATAGDMARLLHELPPDSAALLDPARNLRYGRLYFDRLLRRFDGDVPLALAAYNAGPTNATRWLATSRMLRRRVGGVALDIELMIRPETEDYVKKILAARAAYRALRPTTAPAPR